VDHWREKEDIIDKDLLIKSFRAHLKRKVINREENTIRIITYVSRIENEAQFKKLHCDFSDQKNQKNAGFPNLHLLILTNKSLSLFKVNEHVLAELVLEEDCKKEDVQDVLSVLEFAKFSGEKEEKDLYWHLQKIEEGGNTEFDKLDIKIAINYRDWEKQNLTVNNAGNIDNKAKSEEDKKRKLEEEQDEQDHNHEPSIAIGCKNFGDPKVSWIYLNMLTDFNRQNLIEELRDVKENNALDC